MTLQPSLKIGRADVYVSGSVICRFGHVVEITPAFANVPNPFRIRLSFADGPEDHALPITVVNQPDNGVLVTFTGGPDIASTMAPILVGKLGSDNLYLEVAWYSTGQGNGTVRAVTFVVLKGEA